MSTWHDVKNKSDIDDLKKVYGNFHDSCITELHYISGADVEENRFMIFGESKDRKLSLKLKRQWEPVKIELLFEGMRKMSIVGWQTSYFCEILDCYLEIRNDLVTGIDCGLFVWADDANFCPKKYLDTDILAEPMVSFVVSEELKWRLLDDE